MLLERHPKFPLVVILELLQLFQRGICVYVYAKLKSLYKDFWFWKLNNQEQKYTRSKHGRWSWQNVDSGYNKLSCSFKFKQLTHLVWLPVCRWCESVYKVICFLFILQVLCNARHVTTMHRQTSALLSRWFVFMFLFFILEPCLQEMYANNIFSILCLSPIVFNFMVD